MTEESKDMPIKKKNGKVRFWCNCGFHTWSKWSDLYSKPVDYTKYQKRTCVGCGKAEERAI